MKSDNLLLNVHAIDSTASQQNLIAESPELTDQRGSPDSSQKNGAFK